ncbi:hypothetical protein [Sinorhizobium fredii]|uniref:hypothetical protein n=1 Tax=Rhizobium fredii TaxID=380 RepID=UPI0033971ED2
MQAEETNILRMCSAHAWEELDDNVGRERFATAMVHMAYRILWPGNGVRTPAMEQLRQAWVALQEEDPRRRYAVIADDAPDDA